LQEGHNVYLLSDGGLPAFCDPGWELVDLCHQKGIKVTATPFASSVALSWALSGFPPGPFYFQGFPPAKSEERKDTLKKLLAMPSPVILMDTPYRLTALLEDLKLLLPAQRIIFLGLDLGTKEEQLYRGPSAGALELCRGKKREFVLILGPR
ncbi:MAG: SAM-dependent methyltransferase, partial [Pseudomonadota bacterium]